MNRVHIFLRVSTSIGRIYLVPSGVKTDGRAVQLKFGVAFEKETTLHYSHLLGEVKGVFYELGNEMPIGESSNVRVLPPQKIAFCVCYVPLKFIHELDPEYNPPNP